MQTLTALRVVRASAVYDLLATAPFALPWTAAATIDALGRLHGATGLTGPVPDGSDPLTVLFASLMGSIVVVWALVRLARPSLSLGAFDTLGRALFSLAMVVALTHGVTGVVVPFLVLEVGWLVVQGGVVLLAWRAAAGPRADAVPAPTLVP